MEQLVEDTITYPIKVKRRKWKKFKESIPRSITPNEKINEFIDNHIKENTKEEEYEKNIPAS